MTVRDGFKLGVGLILAQFVAGVLVFALSIPVLYFVGSSLKDKAVQALLSTSGNTGSGASNE